MRNSPCWKKGQGCPKRSSKPNCHETCPDYLEYLQENAKEKIAYASQKAYLGYYYNILMKSRKKGNKK